MSFLNNLYYKVIALKMDQGDYILIYVCFYYFTIKIKKKVHKVTF